MVAFSHQFSSPSWALFWILWTRCDMQSVFLNKKIKALVYFSKNIYKFYSYLQGCKIKHTQVLFEVNYKNFVKCTLFQKNSFGTFIELPVCISSAQPLFNKTPYFSHMTNRCLLNISLELLLLGILIIFIVAIEPYSTLCN